MLNKITPLLIVCSDTTLEPITIDSHTTYFLPEYNLSAKQQRQWARNCAIEVNKGQYTLVITHSDYIIKEFNTLIMLYSKVLNNTGYSLPKDYLHEELLDSAKVTAYDICNGIVKIADIDEQLGIQIESIDEVIQEMNSIQEQLVWED